MKCGATVVLGKEATPAAVEAEAPDAVIVAVGAAFARPPIDGIDLPHVMTVSEADLGTKPVGSNAVICGGGLSGSECAAGLGMAGKKVTVVDILPEEALCQDAVDLVRVALFALLKDEGVERVQGAVKAITTTGVVVALAGGATVELPADTVVIAFGLRPDPAVVEPLLDVVAESYLVGDCRQVGKILTANHDAFNVAVEV